MNTLTKMAFGLIGQLKPTPLEFGMGLDAGQQILLTQTVGMPNASAGT